MPAMPRIKDSKLTKIAFKIMGVPGNMRKRIRTKADEKIEKRLLFEETTQVR